MADEQTTPQEDVNVTEAPAFVETPDQREDAPEGSQEPAGDASNPDGGQAPASEEQAPVIAAEQNEQDLGANPPPDPALAENEQDAREDGVENPPSSEEIASPEQSPEELPVGVPVGGSPVASREDAQGGDAPPASDLPPGTVHAQPVRVDGRNRRSDKDALEGHYVKVRGRGVSGREHDAKKAIFLAPAEYDRNTGYPTRALVRFVDPQYTASFDVVDYEDLQPAHGDRD